MKSLTILLKLLATLALTHSAPSGTSYTASDAAAHATCLKNNAHVAVAIDLFCGKTDMVTPSDYAAEGAKDEHAHVYIIGKCKPEPQWVPTYWCKRQFWEMCAQSTDLHASAVQKYGRDGCQTFVIAGG